MEINESVVKSWRSYFNNSPVYIDVGVAKFIMRDIRKEKRERRKKGLKGLSPTYEYRKNMLTSLLMSTEDYVRGEFLDINGFLNGVNKSILKVSPSFDVTPTYRMVSSNPSLGNLDSYMKKVIRGGEGKNIVSLDYCHQEPWIIVNLLGVEEWKKIIEENDDFYLGILSYFGREETEEARSKVKKVWNSSIYGSSLGEDEEDWVKDIYEWINGNDRVKSLRNKVKKNLKEKKEIYTIFGLNREIPYDGKSSVRKAFNSIFQMSGSGVLYAGLESINNTVRDKGHADEVRVMLTNHDEYVLEVDSSWDKDAVIQLLEDVDFSVEGWTKPRFEISIGEYWT